MADADHRPGLAVDVDPAKTFGDPALRSPARHPLLVVRRIGVIEVPTRRIETRAKSLDKSHSPSGWGDLAHSPAIERAKKMGQIRILGNVPDRD